MKVDAANVILESHEDNNGLVYYTKSSGFGSWD
jgi:hypothetical protein